MKGKLGIQIIVGLFAGIFTGVFLGEYAEPLGYIGDAFIGLMQMTVLPYIMVSLLANLGKLNFGQSKPLIVSGIVIELVFMIIGVAMIQLLPVFFPAVESSSFFSTSLIHDQPPINLLDIYIPSNLFGSMAANAVPAVVLFSIIVGISLNFVQGNNGLINAFDVMAEALNNANKIIVKLTPIGLFGIAAHTTGTVDFSQLSLLQVYIIVYCVAVLVMVMLLLPLIVSAVTPIKYGDFLAVPRNTLITMFATGKIVILIPQLIEDTKELLEKYKRRTRETESAAELMIPLAYPFPNLGTLVIMIFVPFAAWFGGVSLGFTENLQFSASVILSSFVAPITGIPFLLDLLKLPNDSFQLFVISTVITDRIRVVLGGMHLFALTIMAIAYTEGVFKVNWIKLSQAFGISLAALFVVLLPLRNQLGKSFTEAHNQYQSFVEMDMVSIRVPVHEGSLMNQVPKNISDIVQRGYLRVGYHRDALPYVFNNVDGFKVGFDVELMNNLAHELDIAIQWVEIPREEISSHLNSGRVDLFVSGLPILLDDIGHLEFTIPYANHTMSFVTLDANRDQFKTIDQVRKTNDLKLAVPGSRFLFTKVSELIPDAEISFIESPREFFTDSLEFDAMVLSAEAGSAWTLVYPRFSVVVPEDRIVQAPVAIALAEGNLELSEFLDSWLELKNRDGTIDQLYEFWILGKGSQIKEQKWSVIKDVLHWVE